MQNHMFPSGPAVIPNGYEPVSKVSPTWPLRSIEPTLLESFSVNHSLSPEGAAAIAAIPNSPGTGYSVIVPCGVIFPMFRPASSVNQRFPSGPGAMFQGSDCSVSSGNSVWSKGSSGSRRTMLFPISSVNQTLPSGPVVMCVGNWPMPVGNSSTTPVVVILPTWSTFSSVNQKVPSGIAVMSHGWASGVGRSYSVIVPVGVIFPIRLA